MKRLQCEMCNSNDLVKQDGYYICQYCGTKYTVEEAKKMMIEGTVDIKGTVKVDVSEKVKNLYVMARRAKEDKNSELASKYYEMITFENPNDWEALFYFNYYKVLQTTLLNMRNSIIRFANSLESVFGLIDNSDKTEKEKWSIVSEIIAKIYTLCDTCSASAKSHYREFSNVSGSVSKLEDRMFAIADLQKTMADLLEKYFYDKSQELVGSFLKQYVKNYLLLDLLGSGYVNITLKFHSKELIEAEQHIKQIDPSYTPLISKNNNNSEDETHDKESKKSISKKTSIIIVCAFAVVVILTLTKVFSSISGDSGNIIGTWQWVDNSDVKVTYTDDGECIVSGKSGNYINTYSISGNKITINFNGVNPTTETYTFTIKGDRLTLGSDVYERIE